MSNQTLPRKKPKTQSNLETANEMFKFAFMVKKQGFTKKYPHLTEKELHKKTVEYFASLPKDE